MAMKDVREGKGREGKNGVIVVISRHVQDPKC